MVGGLCVGVPAQLLMGFQPWLFRSSDRDPVSLIEAVTATAFITGGIARLVSALLILPDSYSARPPNRQDMARHCSSSAPGMPDSAQLVLDPASVAQEVAAVQWPGAAAWKPPVIGSLCVGVPALLVMGFRPWWVRGSDRDPISLIEAVTATAFITSGIARLVLALLILPDSYPA